jgi:formamidopyrimidine-DNA glycosylase
MPELPDIEAYLHALRNRLEGARLEKIEILTPFLLRSVRPLPAETVGRTVTGFRRIGKRICLGFDNELWQVIHLMIAGRLHWNRKSGSKPLARWTFSSGVLILTEAGSQRRASLHVVEGAGGLATLDPGGLEPLECSQEEFTAAVTRENHTLKRVLTDPHVFSGIGNAFSDEILWQAGLSPVALSQKLRPEEVELLFRATRETLARWLQLLVGQDFPEGVTAFRPEMAVHGRYKQPCPRCATSVQRIRYASNETNYCPRCQTGGKLLADRALSRLLGSDWPRSIEDLP